MLAMALLFKMNFLANSCGCLKEIKCQLDIEQVYYRSIKAVVKKCL